MRYNHHHVLSTPGTAHSNPTRRCLLKPIAHCTPERSRYHEIELTRASTFNNKILIPKTSSTLANPTSTPILNPPKPHFGRQSTLHSKACLPYRNASSHFSLHLPHPSHLSTIRIAKPNPSPSHELRPLPPLPREEK